jgi:dienelactone hydrolase
VEQYKESDENRKIRLQVWYPTDSIEGLELTKWHYDGVESVRGLSIDNHFPSFFLDETAMISSNSYKDAQVSNSFNSYPVIIISHGWRSQRTLHTDIAEELASNGYIVVGIEHTYGSVSTVFEDGTVAYKDPNALPWDESFLQKANQLVNTYADDVTLTLDYLETLNTTNQLFKERLNLSKIGLLGHSTGGGGDVVVSIKDNRIKSFIGLDPWVEPIDETVLSQGIKIPSLILRSEEWETGENNTNLSILMNNSDTVISLYQIENTTHLDFSMMYMYSPLIKIIGFSGSIDSLYLSDMLKTVTTSFFNETLKSDNYEDTQFDSYPEMIKIEKP